MDIAFGTFKGSFNEADRDGPTQRDDAKSSLRLLPTKEFSIYLLGSSVCIYPWAYVAINNYQISSNQALFLSSLVGFGPVILANIVSNIYQIGNVAHPVKMSFIANMLHLFFGTLFCSIPISYGSWVTIKPEKLI
jgi:hypothetical protein